jgi:hypothetical protein
MSGRSGIGRLLDNDFAALPVPGQIFNAAEHPGRNIVVGKGEDEQKTNDLL